MDAKKTLLKHKLIRLADVPDDFPIKKSRLYKWACNKEHAQLFIKIEGMQFLDLDALDRYIKEQKEKGA